MNRAGWKFSIHMENLLWKSSLGSKIFPFSGSYLGFNSLSRKLGNICEKNWKNQNVSFFPQKFARTTLALFQPALVSASLCVTVAIVGPQTAWKSGVWNLCTWLRAPSYSLWYLLFQTKSRCPWNQWQLTSRDQDLALLYIYITVLKYTVLHSQMKGRAPALRRSQLKGPAHSSVTWIVPLAEWSVSGDALGPWSSRPILVGYTSTNAEDLHSTGLFWMYISVTIIIVWPLVSLDESSL